MMTSPALDGPASQGKISLGPVSLLHAEERPRPRRGFEGLLAEDPAPFAAHDGERGAVPAQAVGAPPQSVQVVRSPAKADVVRVRGLQEAHGVSDQLRW